MSQTMHVGLCMQVLYHLPFEAALDAAAALGMEAVELAVDAGSPWLDLDELLAGGHARLSAQLAARGLTLSALSNHQEGQLLLGPYHGDTDAIHPGNPAEKRAYGVMRLLKTAALAERMGVQTVCGFTGCEDYSRRFPWPAPDGYAAMAPEFREVMLPVLDGFAAHGVRFAHECHPKQFAYNLETALWALALVDHHPAFGFNFDPANLLLSGMDPVVFIVELGERIWHVHAKDAEQVRHAVARSGMQAHGAWGRPGRGFRFRVPGWGQLDWRELITALHLAGYTGTFAIEHEDPTLSRREGIVQAARHLNPLMLREPPEGRWW